MLQRRVLLYLVAFAFIFAAAPRLHAQQTAPAPSPRTAPAERDAQEPIKIFTEEVLLPVVAYDDYGHFDPTVESDDLLMLEDGVPQQVKSIRRIPATVVLLLGTGNEMNPAQRTSITRDVALRFASSLRPGDKIAVLQFDRRVETLQDWTTAPAEVVHALNTKLHSGRGSRLAEALTQAAARFKDQPRGNRHLVLIADGVDMPSNADYAEAMKVLAAANAERSGAQSGVTEAMKQLVAAQVTVHVISYAALGQQTKKEKAKSASSSSVPPGSVRASGIERIGIDPTMPPTASRVGASVGIGITFDPQMRRLRKAYEQALKRSEQQLTSLADETGGRILSPTSTSEMIAQGNEVAREIDAQYVVTYQPKRPLANAAPGEYRRIQVSPRRTGLHVRAQRGYVATAIH